MFRSVLLHSRKGGILPKNGLKMTCFKKSTVSRFSTCKVSKKDEIPHYPGATQAPFTKELNFVKSSEKVFPVFHILDVEGNVVNEEYFKEAQADLHDTNILKLYTDMVTLNTMDDILYNAQRQGRVSFYMTNYGEEAIQVGSAAALNGDDHIYAQYREAGVLLQRGFTLREFLAQCFSTKEDPGKGRQMPVHYGSKELHFQTISSPLGTQIPQASGLGYALRISASKAVCVCYFGEGAASEGDFHAALNFAATLNCQTIFVCRNNGYAISTPTEDQYKGDGIVARGIGYGMPSIRVDGNDLLASYLVTKKAREMSIKNRGPVLIEAMTYRGGHHSTSDDASRYRTMEELEKWTKKQNPILRIRKYLNKRGLWDDEKEKALRDDRRQQVLKLLTEMEQAPKPGIEHLITDVYDKPPVILEEQKQFVDKMIEKYPEAYESSH